MKDLIERVREYKTPLDYSGFEEYYYEDPRLKNDKYYSYELGWELGKHQWIFKFENGYGASVIKHFGSYGFEDDLFELAVMRFDGNEGYLDYDTPITDSVIGYLTNNDVLRYLIKIQRLDENGR